jgi:hypothetical protein
MAEVDLRRIDDQFNSRHDGRSSCQFAFLFESFKNGPQAMIGHLAAEFAPRRPPHLAELHGRCGTANQIVGSPGSGNQVFTCWRRFLRGRLHAGRLP